MKSILSLLACLLCVVTLKASDAGRPGEFHFKHPEMRQSWTAHLPKTATPLTDTCYAAKDEVTVYLLAELCGLGNGYETEFILLGRLSDRAYESLAIAWDDPGTIGKAVEALGCPKGLPANADRGLAMAKGERFTMKVKRIGLDENFRPLTDFMVDECSTPAQALFTRGFPYIGGTGFDDDMPAAILSAYTEEKSLFGLPYHAPKSAVYGLFRTTTDEVYGTPAIIALQWQRLPDAQSRVYNHRLTLTPESIQDPDALIAGLKTLCDDPRDVFLQVRFAPELTLAQVTPLAKLLLTLEAEGGFTLDAPEPGQLPLRAFTPSDAWRTREGRVFQPWEVEFLPGTKDAPPAVTLCQILEDWTVDGPDPALTRKCYPDMTPETIASTLQKVDQSNGKVYVTFFYATPETTIGELTPYAEALAPLTPTQWIFLTPPPPMP